MGKVLAGLPLLFCMDYINDILVVGTTFEQHLKNLEAVLKHLRTAGLKLNTQKCIIAQKKVIYLGYVVSTEGIQTDPQKVQAVNDFPCPTNITQLHSFIGLTSYYQQFIRNYT